MDENWDSLADWYVALVREGSAMHEFSRDILLSEIPDILSGTRVLDVGCGEGSVTRALAARGAIATGVDPIARMIYHARLAETGNPLGVDYHVDDGAILSTVDNASVDWVTAALSLNNIPDLTDAVTAIKRVLRHEGHLVFTVPHPCFDAQCVLGRGSGLVSAVGR